jgi:hypothetical protein
MAVTLQEQKAKEPGNVGAWVALIYLPQKEHQSPDAYKAMMHPSLLSRPLVYPFSYQMPPTSEGKDLPASFLEGFTLRPGCNLQVSSEKWAIAINDFAVNWRVNRGSIEVINCSSSDSSSPGYRHFDDKVAIDLVSKTEDIDSIDKWLIGESRSFVINAAKQKKAEIEAELAKRAA